ncbi:MAG: hypothetical protein OXE99_02760, partial [Cellvibrionales bacterium]|nr:hypothetical protein [Cellvibrionales bacterium]
MISPEGGEASEAKADDESYYQIGVGAKIVATIHNIEAGIELTDLATVAATAEKKELAGNISFRRIGINGKLTEIILPGFTKKLEVSTVLEAVENMQKIQLLLYSDDDVSIKPSVLAYSVEEMEELPKHLLGWVYLGHYKNKSSFLTTSYNKGKQQYRVSELEGKTLVTDVQRNVRADRPRWPSYKLPPRPKTVKEGCELKVQRVVELGFDKYWALVSKANECPFVE